MLDQEEILNNKENKENEIIESNPLKDEEDEMYVDLYYPSDFINDR